MVRDQPQDQRTRPARSLVRGIALDRGGRAGLVPRSAIRGWRDPDNAEKSTLLLQAAAQFFAATA